VLVRDLKATAIPIKIYILDQELSKSIINVQILITGRLKPTDAQAAGMRRRPAILISIG
jgi:hypothetical protein